MSLVGAFLARNVNCRPLKDLLQKRIITGHSRCLSHAFITHRCMSSEQQVEFTSNRYPALKRLDFAQLTNDDVGHLRTFLRENQIVTDQFELETNNVDWLRTCRGKSQLMLKPQSTEEVSRILKFCSERRLAVCPQGGNTGLVGGGIPVFDEIILSSTLMNKVISFDDLSGVLICQAGCVLENLENYVSDHSYTMPLDLGAKGSCHIGGNVATNAGGLRLVRYGSLRGNVLGLEIVLASGEVLDCLTSMRKDNTGYDLKQLFIGSEGTLGFVTKVAILCPPKPNSIAVTFLGCSSFEKVLETYREARQNLGEVLSSIEFMDKDCVEVVERNLKIKSPIPSHPFYVLIEVAGADAKHDEDKLHQFLEKVTNNGCVVDGIVATDSKQIKVMWDIRERIVDAQKKDGYVYKYDISLPMRSFADVAKKMRERLAGKITGSTSYGHLGDSNMHMGFVSPVYEQKIEGAIEPYIYELVHELNGSISAEHGVGLKKKTFLPFSKNSSSIDAMKKLKERFDPNGLMNPYKIFVN